MRGKIIAQRDGLAIVEGDNLENVGRFTIKGTDTQVKVLADGVFSDGKHFVIGKVNNERNSVLWRPEHTPAL